MRQHNLWWQSSYDRGLHILLKMWPKIKETYPDATLGIAYGWGLFAQRYADNPERMAWMENVNKLMTQEGITHHGKIGRDKLRELRKKAGILAYPTDFDEIFMMGAIEAQLDGVVPCVINKAALEETVGAGIKIDGDIYDKETYDLFVRQLLLLMKDEFLWKQEQAKGIEFAKKFTWENMASKWMEEFNNGNKTTVSL